MPMENDIASFGNAGGRVVLATQRGPALVAGHVLGVQATIRLVVLNNRSFAGCGRFARNGKTSMPRVEGDVCRCELSGKALR